jgi:hypothetical protein
VQIVYSSHRGSREIEHLGSAHSGAEVELLKAAAQQRLAAGQGELDLRLSAAAPGGPLSITSSRMGHLLAALAHGYRVLGSPRAGTGCSGSWCWPGSSSPPASCTADGCWKRPVWCRRRIQPSTGGCGPMPPAPGGRSCRRRAPRGLRHRHGYAGAIHRGLPAHIPHARPGVPRSSCPDQVRTAPGPCPPDLSRSAFKGRSDAGSSRTPLRHARRIRAIWQY